MNPNLHKVIGIDLGTTYSAVASYNSVTEAAEIIYNQETAAQTTPSVVSVDPVARKVIVGVKAKQNLASDPVNTIIEIKREMGEDFRDETKLKYNMPGKRSIEQAKREGGEADPVVVRFNGCEDITPQEISAFILMRMKEIAEQEIGSEIIDAIVTVPAYFTEKQKKATKEAARLAGLYPVMLIPEPTAAAICYGVDRYEDTKQTYLVYDLGGGTFDVSIIKVEGSQIDVVSTCGNPRLGGGDFDDALAKWALGKLKSDFGMDLAADLRARAYTKFIAEQVKIILGTKTETDMCLPELRPANPPILHITRDEFIAMIQGKLDESMTYIDIALANANGITKENLSAVLLVGGSSKIPKVREMLIEKFGRGSDFVRSDLDCDAVVARGAAIMASKVPPSAPPYDINRDVTGGLNAALDDVKLIAEHTLGINTEGDIFSPIIPLGTVLPVTREKSDYSNSGPSPYIPVEVYQGESEYSYNNTLIGTLQIGPMEPKEKGYHKFKVAFTIDRSGLLSMKVNHVNEGKTYEARFDQKTSIGKEMLAAKRDRLLTMYMKPAGQQPGATPPPPPPPPPAPETPAVQAQQAPEAKPAVAVSAREVPEQFKMVVRKVQKQLLTDLDPELLRGIQRVRGSAERRKVGGRARGTGGRAGRCIHTIQNRCKIKRFSSSGGRRPSRLAASCRASRDLRGVREKAARSTASWIAGISRSKGRARSTV